MTPDLFHALNSRFGWQYAAPGKPGSKPIWVRFYLAVEEGVPSLESGNYRIRALLLNGYNPLKYKRSKDDPGSPDWPEAEVQKRWDSVPHEQRITKWPWFMQNESGAGERLKELAEELFDK